MLDHDDTSEPELSELGMFMVNEYKFDNDAIVVDMDIAGHTVKMEVDTGAKMSIIPEDLYRESFAHIPLARSYHNLHVYNGNRLGALGQALVQVKYQGQCKDLGLLVAKIDGQPPILGRNWLQEIRLDWSSIFRVSGYSPVPEEVQSACSKRKAVFTSEGLGKMKTHTAKMYVKENAVPKFHKARPIPYALKPAVEAQIDKLVTQGILTPVNHSEWAAPCVIVPKRDGTVRIYGDYKVTVNPQLDVDKYPLPTAQDLFATLAGGKYFTTLDLTQAYQQMELDPDSRKYLTINTCRGLFQYTRLPYGVSSAPSIFQNAIEQILQGLDGVVVFLDYILISAKDKNEHMQRLDAVLARLEQYGLTVKQSKCKFLQTEVTYLGHVISERGISPSQDKVQGIDDAPIPRNVHELKSFLGLLQYYGKFIPNLSDLVQPLNALQCSHVPFIWTPECDAAFMKAKAALSSETFLTHYDVKRPLLLACDASAYGIGAVLSHVMDDGSERPIAFASRMLTSSERNYAQLQKEALSLVFGVKKFHQYLYARHFTLITDHKPLLAILGPKRCVPTLAAARLQRWAIVLSAYRYDIIFKSTGEHLNADAMSRLPVMLAEDEPKAGEEPSIFHVTMVNELPVSSKDIAEATCKDPVLSKVYEYTMSGWPRQVDEQLKPYFHRKLELSVECGVVLWGLRVCVPMILRERVLSELHSEHQGISRMKSLSRSYFWWPKLDTDIEQIAKNCQTCLSVKNQPAAAPLHPWHWATHRFERVHVDFAEREGKSFLVFIDVYSKWLEVIIVPNITTSALIEALRPIFAAHGFPETIVSDNGPAFISAAFSEFCAHNGIEHKLTPPYHPASNGAAERSVQILKQALKTSQGSGLTLQHRVANFLLVYRNTPHATTGCTPAELFLKCQPRIRLSLMKPSLAKVVENKQAKMKEHHDGKRSLREFLPGDNVNVLNFRGKEKWMQAVVLQRLGPVTYVVKCGQNIRYVHIDHLSKGCSNANNSNPTELLDDHDIDIPTDKQVPVSGVQALPQNLPQAPVASSSNNKPSEPPNAPATSVRTYPQRARKKPERLDL